MPTSTETVLRDAPTVDEVSLNIDYNIIQHFSQHLYGSPNKAIEELVANAFDAMATKVFVYIPGRYATNAVVVWDNGLSMDVEGLKSLWWIARSPKMTQPNRLGRRASVEDRLIIGKFGIGKLASYAVGHRITHLCKSGGSYHLVSIDYTLVGEERDHPEVALTSPIKELTEDAARAYVTALFSERPRSVDEIFNEDSWTLALIEELKGRRLTEARLKWVVGNGMPLRPDFGVFVNDVAVVPKLARDGAVRAWTFGDEEFVAALTGKWAEAVKRSAVEGELRFVSFAGLDPAASDEEVPAVVFPELGTAWGTTTLYDRSLDLGKADDEGRSYGFFILVRGRLINPDDDKLFLSEPSFGTFYRSQFVINADGLDEDLLADRERLSVETPRARELAVLQQTMYLLARKEQARADEVAVEQEAITYRLPVRSREFYREPIAALLAESVVPPEPFDIASIGLERESQDAEGPIARLNAERGVFELNVLHPYYQVLEKRFGTGRLAQEFRREYELIAVSEVLFKGFLREAGLPIQRIDQIVDWRDGLLRSLASLRRDTLPELSDRLVDASYRGGKDFENAIADVLRAMGLIAERDGASGKKDGLFVASAGQQSYRFTFEAKGSVGQIANDDAEISGASAHRESAGAAHAVVFAREFAGFARSADPQILKECRAQDGRVSIMTVEALLSLLRVVWRYSYPVELLQDIFTAVETPAEKMARIENLGQPTTDFDYRAFIESVYAYQVAKAGGTALVPCRAIYNEEPWHSRFPEYDDFRLKVTALATVAFPVVVYDLDSDTVVLHQSPDHIVNAIHLRFEGEPSAAIGGSSSE
jgi:hypothetical protein